MNCGAPHSNGFCQNPFNTCPLGTCAWNDANVRTITTTDTNTKVCYHAAHAAYGWRVCPVCNP